MSLSFIRTAIDREQPPLGDVVIVKHSKFQPSAPLQLVTICSHCGKDFPAQFRRMGKPGTKRALEVRNVPQCPACRSRYPKKAKTAAAQQELELRPKPLGPGDVVRCVEPGNYNHPGRELVAGKLYQLVEHGSKWASWVKTACRPFVQPAGYEDIGPCFARRFVRVSEAERRQFLGEPAFRPGDRVRVKEAYSYLRGQGFETGSEGVVLRYGRDGNPALGPYVWLAPRPESRDREVGGSEPSRFELLP